MKDKIWMKLAQWLPRSLVYWASVRLFCYGTVGKYSNQVVPELAAMDALKRWRE